MANYRQIHTKIWRDPWFIGLAPDEKLLFIYFCTNESTNLAGIYELSPRVIEFDTGLDGKRIEKILEKFSADRKVFLENNLVWVVNLRKYHETPSIKVQTRIESDVNLLPNCDLVTRYLRYYERKIGYRYGIDTPSLIEEEEEENKEEEEEVKKSNKKKTLSPESEGAFLAALKLWGDLFPEKTQPRSSTDSYRKKWGARWKNDDFRESWEAALLRADRCKTLHEESWFTFSFFVRNDENYLKMLDGWMEWKDDNHKTNSDQQRSVIEKYKRRRANGEP